MVDQLRVRHCSDTGLKHVRLMMMSESLTAVKAGPIVSVCPIVLILLKWELQDLFSYYKEDLVIVGRL